MIIQGTVSELLDYTQGTRKAIKQSPDAKKALKKARRKLKKAMLSSDINQMKFYMGMAKVAIQKAIVTANLSNATKSNKEN